MCFWVCPLEREVPAVTLPTFIVIGPGKTGTTWLYTCLAAHPQVRLARHTKETVFFNDYYSRGLAWYERFFRGYEGAPAIGEISNNYFFSPEAPARIAKDVPNIKLITILRNPVDRLNSAYNFFKRWQVPSTEEFEETIARNPRMISNNFYDEFLERWLEHFPRDRILVVLYDDIRTRPDHVLREIQKFIGVDADFKPPMMTEKVLPPSNPRNARVFRAIKRFSQWLRNHDYHRLLTWAKLNPTMAKILTKQSDEKKAPIPEHIHRRLQEIYRPHIDRLEAMIDRDLSAWK